MNGISTFSALDFSQKLCGLWSLDVPFDPTCPISRWNLIQQSGWFTFDWSFIECLLHLSKSADLPVDY